MTGAFGGWAGSGMLRRLGVRIFAAAVAVATVTTVASGESLSSRMVYQLARRELMLSEVRSMEDVKNRLARFGLVAELGGWKHEDEEGRVLVTPDMNLHVYIVGFIPTSSAPLPAEVLSALGRAAKRVKLDGPDQVLYEFDGDLFGRSSSRKVTVVEDVAVRIRDGSWDHSKTTIQYEP